MAIVGRQVEVPYQRAWLQRARGHSKTLDVSVKGLFALFASRHKINGIVVAGDQDQAGFYHDKASAILSLRENAWLANVIKIKAKSIENTVTGSVVDILTSDASTSWGHTPSFICADEVSVWKSDELFYSVLSAASKRRICPFEVITNAGFNPSWQYELFERIEIDPDWYVSVQPGVVASWLSEARLAEQKRILPAPVFARCYENRWCSGAGDALLAADIDNAIRLDGPTPRAEKGWQYVCGVDLSTNRDWTAVAVVAKHVGWVETKRPRSKRYNSQTRAMIDLGILDPAEEPNEYVHHTGTGRMKLVRLRTWKPTNGNRVDLADVESEIVGCHQTYGLSLVSCDQWQAEYLLQRLASKGIRVDACHFTGPTLQEMAVATLDSFREQRLDIFDHADLIADLKHLRVVEKSYGYRLQSPRSATRGHGDASQALSIALRAARRLQVGSANYSQRQLVLSFD